MNLTKQKQQNDYGLQNRFFHKALESKRPLQWQFLKRLNEDVNFKKELDYYRPTTVKASAVSIPTNIEQQIFNFLSETGKKLMLLTAMPGAGKSFFAKKFAREQLNHYETDRDYLPIFVPLQNFKSKQLFSMLVETALKWHGVSDSLEATIQDLKDRKVLWILDAYDEIKFENSNNGLFIKNLYDTNKLVNWKNSKFLVTCRQGFCHENKFYPQNNSQQFSSCQLEFSQDDYIQSYLRDDSIPEWNQIRYRDILTRLANSNNNFDSSKLYPSPLLFKAILIALPKIELMGRGKFNVQKTIEDFLDDENLKAVILSWIKQAVACAVILRASQKIEENAYVHSISIVEMVDFCIKTANYILNSAAVSEKGLRNDEVDAFFKNIQLTDLNQQMVLKTTFLVPTSEGYWQFSPQELLLYFRDLGNNEALQKELKDFLLNDKFEFNGNRFYL